MLGVKYILRISMLGFHWKALDATEDLGIKQTLSATLPQAQIYASLTIIYSEIWPLRYVRNTIQLPKITF